MPIYNITSNQAFAAAISKTLSVLRGPPAPIMASPNQHRHRQNTYIYIFAKSTASAAARVLRESVDLIQCARAAIRRQTMMLKHMNTNTHGYAILYI